ncbi:MAG: winged helix-turn-helix transcriptional regulator [Clostridiales bacterium]|nr:winged helix-turn-helix transcriptional regulator [Clostridiales bacterium]
MAVYYDEIKILTEKLFHKLIQYSAMKFTYENKEIYFIDLIILSEIMSKNEISSMNEWMDYFEIKRIETKKSINRLINNKFLTKEQNLMDKRKVMINVTEKGLDVLKTFDYSEESYLNFILRDMTVNEEKTILKFLSKLNQLTVDKYKK